MSRARSVVGRYPAAAVVPLAWLWVLADHVTLIDYGISVGLLVLAVAVEVWRVEGSREGAVWSLSSSFVFLAAVGVLREAGGGLASGVGILALVPVFQAALFGRHPRELWAILVGEAALYLVPVLIVGGSEYPQTQYRGGVLVVAVSIAVGLATQQLVGRVRRDARDARESREMLEQVTGVIHELSVSGDTRADLCEGALRVAGAAVAVLFEPVPERGVLRATAGCGVAIDGTEVPIDPGNPIGAAFLGGHPLSSARITVSEVADREMWRSCGCPRSLLYQPVQRDGEPIGLFSVAWHDADMVTAARTGVVGLLAREAALALDRADHMTRLTGMAQTDPLTGLPNRRAWDDHVARALRESRRITVALLDIDHFKRFNDTYGHQAGDRLLRETGAAWRGLLRGDDVLARLGGEEFGLLLLDCEPGGAVDVTERLRCAMAGGETCSAGIAERRPDEPFDAVVARADRALYDAKSAGRDLALLAA